MDNLPSILDLANKLGALGTWVLFGWLLFTGKIVFKRELDNEKEERQRDREEHAKDREVLNRFPPAIERASEAVSRSMGVASEAVEAAKKSNGQAG